MTVAAPRARSRDATRPRTVVPWAAAAAAIVLQIAYPLTPTGVPRDRLTVATVVVFCAASVAHAAATRGWRFTGLLVAVTTAGGLVVEAVGVATGIPFGSYAYTSTLGPSLLGVPVVIALAWTMMGYPALIVGRRITTHRVLGPIAAGAALAAWDLFLDPQMVAAGLWAWGPTAGPHLLGVPAANFAGWLGVATVMMAVLWRATPPPVGDDRVPLVLYVWTYLSSLLAHAVFLDLPGSALMGGIGMGAVVAVLVLAQRRRA